MGTRLKELRDAGVSIWLDDLSRARLRTGSLAELVAHSGVTGVTTNPTIFAAALARGEDYAAQLRELGDVLVDRAIKELCAADVREACDLLQDVARSSKGYDGWVSIEVAPTLAHDVEGTVAEAVELRDLVGRDNVLVKIPATDEGVLAVEEVIARGISVNVTPIFSVERYAQVMQAYVRGLERALRNGLSIRGIHSVASFFISRVDTEVDRRLSELGRSDLRGRTAIANALLAYGAFEEFVASPRFRELLGRGANVQRPLWASTGTKDPALPDTIYVSASWRVPAWSTRCRRRRFEPSLSEARSARASPTGMAKGERCWTRWRRLVWTFARSSTCWRSRELRSSSPHGAISRPPWSKRWRRSATGCEPNPGRPVGRMRSSGQSPATLL